MKTVATGVYTASATFGRRLRDLNLDEEPNTQSGSGSKRTREAVDCPSEFEAGTSELRRKKAPKASTTEGKIQLLVQGVGEMMKSKGKHQTEELKCTLETCVKIVTAMEGVQSSSQMKALLELKNITMRMLFLAMPANLQREWVMSHI